ncbi:MAG TPA: SGNH/GDSL hydrolase family protein [Kofleriaceae bacterium]
MAAAIPRQRRNPTRWRRYVAIGDSSTEGLDDPDGAGGYRGWADRLAEHIASAHPGLLYANLGVRGRSAGEIRTTQLAPALAMQPDLATVVAGMNDLLRRRFDAVAVASEVGEMVRGLCAIGATVITFTIPDVSRRMRLGARMTARTVALNRELQQMAEDAGALLLDLAGLELAHDPRMWAVDRIHGNSEGHARIGEQLAHMLGIPGCEPGLHRPVEPPPPRRRRELVVEDLAWVARFVAPWAWRRMRGRTTGDGIEPKRPQLAPVKDTR